MAATIFSKFSDREKRRIFIALDIFKVNLIRKFCRHYNINCNEDNIKARAFKRSLKLNKYIHSMSIYRRETNIHYKALEESFREEFYTFYDNKKIIKKCFYTSFHHLYNGTIKYYLNTTKIDWWAYRYFKNLYKLANRATGGEFERILEMKNVKEDIDNDKNIINELKYNYYLQNHNTFVSEGTERNKERLWKEELEKYYQDNPRDELDNDIKISYIDPFDYSILLGWCSR